MDVLEHVRSRMAENRLLRRGAKIVVGVSGGLDSVVLLHVLHRLADAERWVLHVAHLHHGLRGRAATEDQKFVERLARRLSLPWITERSDVRGWARDKKVSVEMAAREMRHAFLARAASQSGAKTVALAHHADDQVELFFLRLLRGAGSEGLSGMGWKSPSPARAGLSLIRPLLDVPKQRLIDFARQHEIEHREDASNTSHEHLRNRVRAELLPLLESDYQPGLRAIILRQMELQRAESDFIAKSVRQRLRGDRDSTGEVDGAFEQWHPALQRKYLQWELRRRGVEAGFELIEELRRMKDHPVNLSGGRILARDHRGNLFEWSGSRPEFVREERAIPLRSAKGIIRFGGIHARWKFEKGIGDRLPSASPGSEWFDGDRVGDTVVLRHWREGDRFQPIGMKRPVKLQDWFTNLKIPVERRRALVVAATVQGHIWWVEGLRIGEKFKVTANTKRRLHWSWDRTAERR